MIKLLFLAFGAAALSATAAKTVSKLSGKAKDTKKHEEPQQTSAAADACYEPSAKEYGMDYMYV